MTFDSSSKGTVYYATSLALLGCAALTLAQKYFRYWTTPLRKIPGPQRKSFLLGEFFTVFKEPFMDPHKRWWKSLSKKYDSLPFISYTSLFGRYTLVVLDCDFIKLILTETSSRDPVRFPKRYVFLQNIVGHGLVTLEGAAWSRHRRIIQPSFQTSILREALNDVVPNLTQQLVDSWSVTQGREIDIFSHLSALTLDIIGQVAFGHDFGGTRTIQEWETSQEELSEVGDDMLQSLKQTLKPSLLGILMVLLGLNKFRNIIDRKWNRTRKLLNQAVDRIVEEQARTKQNSSRSLLQLLLEATDESSERTQLSKTELRDETKTFIVAGHETTSTWCYWSLYVLAKYPEVQDKLFAHVALHWKDPSISPPVDQMDYLHAVLYETLRLYTPVGMLVRFTSQTETWKGYTIPANTRMILPLHLLHRHPDHWTDPEEFRPERWLDDSSDRHKFAFLPFSAGGRNCIGQRFAELEVKLILSVLVRRFRFRFVDPDQSITFTTFISMKSKPMVRLRVSQRD